MRCSGAYVPVRFNITKDKKWILPCRCSFCGSIFIIQEDAEKVSNHMETKCPICGSKKELEDFYISVIRYKLTRAFRSLCHKEYVINEE